MKYLRRLLWFIATRLIAISVIIALLTLAFYLSMDTANIYVLLSDGMKARAGAILTREDADTLTNFFTSEYLLQDETLNIGLSSASPYYAYNISSFNYEMNMEWMWAWPWENTATATISERVPRIAGSVLSEYKGLVESGELTSTPPSWYGGRYEVTLSRINGQWKIAGLRQTQLIIEPTPVPAQATVPAA